MNWLIALMGLSVAATMGAGIWLTIKPRRLPAAWLKGGVLANLVAVRPGAGRRDAAGRAGSDGGRTGGRRRPWKSRWARAWR